MLGNPPPPRPPVKSTPLPQSKVPPPPMFSNEFLTNVRKILDPPLLAKTNNTQIKLKEEQKEDIRQIVNARDVKSLIYQLLPSMFDYINSRKRNISAVLPETIVIVISPLNALVGDQIDKLKTDMGVKAVVLRHDDHDQEMKGVLYYYFVLKILHFVIFVYKFIHNMYRR